MTSAQQKCSLPAILLSPDGDFAPCPTVMTEEELVLFLRIPEISNATDYSHVIENLKRRHGLPRIPLCGKAVYLADSITAWLEKRVTCGQ